MSLIKYKNLKPEIIKDIFSNYEFKNLYKSFKKSENDYTIIPELGYAAFSIKLDEDIILTLKSTIENKLNIKVAKMEAHYARYSLNTGYKPMLMPHYDRALTDATFSLAIVLDNTIDWDIYVEGEQFMPRKNDAVLFSGSHHIHYRPDIEFKDEDYYDIMVCQFYEDTDQDITLDEEHIEYMNGLTGKWCLEWERIYDVETYNKKMNYNGSNE
jgi:hypothetical protein